MRRPGTGLRNERGVALLIALLVMALLLALIFEFAYGTRVSLRAAVNMRDGERAALLARSGIAIFSKYKELQDLVPQGEWGTVPLVSQGDTELRIRWEDEGGKIKIGPGSVDAMKQEWFRRLLTETGVSQDVADRLFGQPPVRISLLPELHQVMSDEEFRKIERFVTVHSTGAININAAAETVLKSVLWNKNTSPDYVLMMRRDRPVEALPTDINNSNFSTTGAVLRVQCSATVGGFTKQADAVVQRDGSGGYSIRYWRML